MLLWLHPFHIELVWRLSEFAFLVRNTSVGALFYFVEVKTNENKLKTNMRINIFYNDFMLIVCVF